SESLRAEIRGTQQAIRNAQDGVSWVQTAEGALQEVHSILQRMRQLAVDAANTATTDGEAQQDEVAQLLDELEAIGARTTFAGTAVFRDYSAAVGDGGAGPLTFHVDARSTTDGGQVLEITENLSLSKNVFGVNLTTLDVSGGGADAAIATIDNAIKAVSDKRSVLGATQNRLEHTIANLSVAVENLSASESRIRVTDMAEEMVAFTRHQIMAQAGTAMLAQANVVPQSVLRLLG